MQCILCKIYFFGKFFTSTIILYVLLFAQKFYFCEKWVLHYALCLSTSIYIEYKSLEGKTTPDTYGSLRPEVVAGQEK
jgi:hypothetical protein